MLLTPDRYAESTTEELLTEASLGRLGVDHAWIAAILARDPEETAQTLAAFYMDMDEEIRIDLSAEIFHLLRALRSTAAIPVYVDLLHDSDDDDPTEVMGGSSSCSAPPPKKQKRATQSETDIFIQKMINQGISTMDEYLQSKRFMHNLQARLSSRPERAESLNNPIEGLKRALETYKNQNAGMLKKLLCEQVALAEKTFQRAHVEMHRARDLLDRSAEGHMQAFVRLHDAATELGE